MILNFCQATSGPAALCGGAAPLRFLGRPQGHIFLLSC